MGSMRDKVLAAFKQAGVKLPNANNKARRGDPLTKSRHDVTVAYGSSKLANKPQTKKTARASNRPVETSTIDQSPIGKTTSSAAKPRSTKALPKPTTVKRTEAAKPTSVQLEPGRVTPPISVILQGVPQYQFKGEKHGSAGLIKRPVKQGVQMQLSPDGQGDAHDVTLGFDFGTSAAKVVVGDATIEKYFAVPFRDGTGINQYLLPCRVWETSDTRGPRYSLTAGETVYRDLKLSLLAEPDNKQNLIRAIAFFALVFQQVRAWLFTEHDEIYRAADLYWSLAIGLPSESHVGNALTSTFERAVRIAWKVSVNSEIRPGAISAIFEKTEAPKIDAEVSVVPEIAAQIYGFVSSPSSSFDKKRANRYAIVDIGAGTVDSSIFEVKQQKGVWNFTYYTAVVEPNGVANLHAYRIGWWTKILNTLNRAEATIQDLSDDRYSTDAEAPIPESYTNYIANVAVRFNDEKRLDPDAEFFSRRLVRQVKGRTIWRCWDKNLLKKEHIEGMPIFVCGGGARMGFYANLLEVMSKTEQTPWISLVPLRLKRPTDLACREVADGDYDRLSVAYGLSRLHLGTIDTAQPLPQDPDVQTTTFQDRYIDKDQV